MDGGIAAPAFTFCFSIPVFTFGVFSTDESLCTEVVTCGERDKGSLDVVWPQIFVQLKQETSDKKQRNAQTSNMEAAVEVEHKVDGCRRLETKNSLIPCQGGSSF